MPTIQNSTPLQEVIEILKKPIKNISPDDQKELKIYEQAKQGIEQNIYELINNYNLFYNATGINMKDFHDLYNILNAVKDNGFFTLSEEQINEIKEHEIYISIMSYINSKISELTPGKDINELIERLRKKEDDFLSEQLQLKIFEILKKYNMSIDDGYEILDKLTKHNSMVLKQRIAKFAKLEPIEPKYFEPVQPPVTAPPVIETQPPVTEPAVTEPPRTEPPVTEPPVQPVTPISPQVESIPTAYEERHEENQPVKTKITDEQLEELFNKYGYDYKKVSKEHQKMLLANATLSNIEDMFMTLPKCGIKFDEKQKQHIGLLIKSSKECLDTIKNICRQYNLSFNDIVGKIPAVLMHKSYSKERKRVKAYGVIAAAGNEWYGAFEDFCANIELVKNLGRSITTEMKSAPGVFASAHSRLKLNVEILKEYGFGEVLARSDFKLDGLKATHIREIIDIFIELGELQYLKNNASRLKLNMKSASELKLVQKIYFAKKNRIPNIKKTWRGKTAFSGIITDPKDTTLDSLIKPESIKHTIFDANTDSIILSTLEEIQKNIDEISIDYSLGKEKIDELDHEYRLDADRYNFNGTSISIRKVKRIYPILLANFQELDKKKLLLYAITYNSMMDQDEFENIEEIIVSKEKRI